MAYAMVICEIKLFRNYFSLHRRPSEMIIRISACGNLPEIISELFHRLMYFSSS